MRNYTEFDGKQVDIIDEGEVAAVDFYLTEEEL